MKATFLFTMLFLILQIFVLLGFQNYEAYLDIITPPIFVLCWFLIVFAVSLQLLLFLENKKNK